MRSTTFAGPWASLQISCSMARSKHPLTVLQNKLAALYKVRSEVKTIDGNRILFSSWYDDFNAMQFVDKLLKPILPDGYKVQYLDVCGLTMICVTKVQTDRFYKPEIKTL